MVKRCPKCETVKPVTEFSPDRSRRDGRATQCRPCNAEKSRAYYAKGGNRNTPCAGCGKLLAGGRGSLPAGERTCQECRRGRTKGCAHCSGQFKPRDKEHRFCTKPCADQALRLTSRPCEWCSAEFAPDESKRRYCSLTCKWDADRKPEVSKVYIVDCGECTKPFVARRKGKELCSAACRDARQARRYHENPKYRDGILAGGHMRRAHKLGLNSSRDVNLTYLIERDGGRCGLCHKLVRDKKGPMRPSIDHIIPLSRGGTNTLDNVHLAHYRCNLSKGNRGGNEQLLLVG